MKIYSEEEYPQGSDTWFDLRKGVITASRMGRILTPKTLQPSAQADGLLAELIGERFSLIPPEGVENFTNRAVRWGTLCEDEARRWYSMEKDVDVRRVGFIATNDGRFGASPDGLVGENGGLELKCPQADTHIKYLLAGVLPDEYKAQVHGSLIVSRRDWWDFLSYSPMKGDVPSAFCIRVWPDEFTKKLEEELEKFWQRYQEAMTRIAVRGTQEKHDASQEKSPA